jgi:hypothetical protein
MAVSKSLLAGQESRVKVVAKILIGKIKTKASITGKNLSDLIMYVYQISK